MSEIVIIGGGAAGMMAAARLSVPGSRCIFLNEMRNSAKSCSSPERDGVI